MPASFPSSSLNQLLISSSVSVVLLAAVLATSTQGAETIIVNGVTVTQQTVQAGDTLTVQAGGTIQDNAADAVVDNLAGTITINNQGSILATSWTGISAANAAIIVDNSGLIIGSILGIKGDAGIISLTNGSTGLIGGGTSYGVYGAGIGIVDNAGTIQGVSGIRSNSTLNTLTNTGNIEGSTAFGVQSSSITTLSNAAGATITGDTGVHTATLLSALTNAGTIEGVTSGVVSAGTIGSIDNSGTIKGNTSYAVSATTITTLTNAASGLIDGGVFAADIASLVNAGWITGITVQSNLDTLTNQAGATIISSGNVGVAVNGTLAQLSNAGTIQGFVSGVDANDLGVLTNNGNIAGGNVGGGGVVANNIATLNNTSGGTISGLSAVKVAGSIGAVDNEGLIDGAIRGLDVAGTLGGLNNSGTIQGGSYGMAASAITSMTNSGAINGIDGISVTDLNSLTNTATGTITGSNFAVNSANLGSVNNAGIIKGNVGGVFASVGGITSLSNSGMITGGAGYGVRAAGDIGAITNSGTISGDTGIDTNASIGSVENSGAISGRVHGITVGSKIATLTNSGTINGTVEYGVYAVSDLGSVTNTGAITGFIAGIESVGTIGSLTNTGVISATGGNGIMSAGLLTLTNSGTIAGATSADFAIVESNPALATDTVLNLNAGSILIGHVDIQGGTNTLNVGPGLNLALTFDGSAPEVVNAGSSAMVLVGNTVYVADASTLAATGDATANLSGGLASLAAGALDKGFDEKGIDGSGHYWLETLGGMGTRPGRNGGAAIRDGFAGFAVGADFGPDAETRFGAFAGAARGVVDNGNQTNSSNSFYAGIYAGGQFDDFSLKGTLSAGTSHGNGSRLVANNTVATGLEHISGSGDAYFVSPGIMLTKPWTTPDMTFETSLAFNYTGLLAGAYGESSPVGLNLDAAITHVFSAAGLIKLPMQMQNENGLLSGDVHAGVEGRTTIDPDLSGTLGGKPVSLAKANVATTAGLLAGGALAFEIDSGVTLFGGLDATLRSDASASAVANVGFKGSF